MNTAGKVKKFELLTSPLVDEDLSIEGLLRSAGREDLIVREIPSIYLEEEAPVVQTQQIAYSHK